MLISMYSNEYVKSLLPLNYSLLTDKEIRNKLSYFSVSCDKGHLWVDCQIAKLIRGATCPICNRSKVGQASLLSEDEFNQRLLSKGYKSLSSYQGMHKRIVIECLTCGSTRTITAYNSQDTCRICSNSLRNSLKDKEILDNLEINNISMLSKDGNRYMLKCKKCLNTYSVIRKSLIRKPYCTKCSSNKSLTLTDIKYRVGSDYTVDGDYLNEWSILRFVHLKCGGIFHRSWNSFQQGLVCPECCANKKYTKKEVVDLLQTYGLLWLDNTYVNVDSELVLKCKVTYHKAFIKSIHQLSWSEIYHCPECQPKQRSSQEEIISQHIEKLGFEVVRNDRSFGKEIDIYIPSRKLGIEYCGHNYHNHSKRLPTHHIDKQEFLKLKNIDVLFVFDNQWKRKESLFHWLDSIVVDPVIPYTSVCILPYLEGLNFLNAHHCDPLQGTASYIFIGGFVGQDLRGVLVFKTDCFKAVCVRHIHLSGSFLKEAISLMKANNFADIKATAKYQSLEHIPFERMGYVGKYIGTAEYIVKGWHRKKYDGGAIPLGWFRLTGCKMMEFDLV